MWTSSSSDWWLWLSAGCVCVCVLFWEFIPRLHLTNDVWLISRSEHCASVLTHSHVYSVCVCFPPTGHQSQVYKSSNYAMKINWSDGFWLNYSQHCTLFFSSSSPHPPTPPGRSSLQVAVQKLHIKNNCGVLKRSINQAHHAAATYW